ncbi:hypothetical protein C7M61_002077 [Candidozyma pseudohaemuli]|uniref:Uncharacterized protein n=1 Tax=Candidozyma pseudohaemuli TaxID=418784 RepID=A0A2P7YU17_9ASCO|nr:hypothetical protein C7M61_002077 [[Candida] pseudohaemulonii]PSK39463.1 hypothetical protein C7M61_002077 [[Candida] pseudohaemulonii]
MIFLSFITSLALFGIALGLRNASLTTIYATYNLSGNTLTIRSTEHVITTATELVTYCPEATTFVVTGCDNEGCAPTTVSVTSPSTVTKTGSFVISSDVIVEPTVDGESFESKTTFSTLKVSRPPSSVAVRPTLTPLYTNTTDSKPTQSQLTSYVLLSSSVPHNSTGPQTNETVSSIKIDGSGDGDESDTILGDNFIDYFGKLGAFGGFRGGGSSGGGSRGGGYRGFGSGHQSAGSRPDASVWIMFAALLIV